MRIYFTVLSILLALTAGAESAHAQSALYLEPSVGVFSIGDPFTVDVRIDTGGATIGTADVSLEYDPNDMAFVSISDDDSVMSRILVDSNSEAGRLDLSGFIERNTPAYSGTDGLIARVTFTPLRNVATQLRFTRGAATPPLALNASVGDLANILTNLRSASYTFVPRETLPRAQVAGATTNTSDSGSITPLPVPESDWFGTSTIQLSWSLPDGIDEMRTVLSQNGTDEENVYPVPVSSVVLKDLNEGTYIFSVQFQKDGQWGTAERYQIQIDLTPPDTIVIREAERTDPSKPTAFVVEAHDEHSGIRGFEVSVDGEDEVPWDGVGTFTPEVSGPGEHVLSVTAYDFVGNKKSQDYVFLVRALNAPVLTYVPERVLTGDSVTVSGTTYPNASVTAYISINEGDPKEVMVESDSNGVFDVDVTSGAREGTYTIWLQVAGEGGSMSPTSIKRSFSVSQPYIMLWGGVAVTYLSVIVPLVALIIVLVLVLWLGYTSLVSHRRRVRREAGEAYSAVTEEFTNLRDDLRRQLGMLQKATHERSLTREEMKIIRDLSKKLNHIERHIKQEIEDIAPGTVSSDTQDVPPEERPHHKLFEHKPPSEHTVLIVRK